jgi:hypothetical protein
MKLSLLLFGFSGVCFTEIIKLESPESKSSADKL